MIELMFLNVIMLIKQVWKECIICGIYHINSLGFNQLSAMGIPDVLIIY